MTDTPGWTSPGSTEPSPEAEVPQAAVPQAAIPQDAVPPQPPAYQGGYGYPGSQGGSPGGPGGWGGPPPGWGPQPGWSGPQPGAGYPGWGAPPSPKPGIIPLRPLSVGELLDGSVATVRKHWRTVLGLSVALGAVSQTAEAFASLVADSADPGNLVNLLPLIVSLLLGSLLGIVANGLLTVVVSKAVLGQQTTLKEAWQAARPRLARLLGLSLLSSLIAGVLLGVGFVLPFGVLLYATRNGGAEPWMILLFPVCLPLVGVGVWLWIKLSLSAPALILERQGVTASMRRSWRLVKGSWWRLFGITLLTALLVSLISGMAMAPFTIVSALVGGGGGGLFGTPAAHPSVAGLVITAVGGTLISAVTIPISAAMGVLLYIDQRIRREALDIELARAAGLPEYGGTGWAVQGATVPGPSTPPGA